MKRLLLSVLFVAAWPAWAQFIGYTLPQTTQQTIFTDQAVAATSAPVRNIGQSVHGVTFRVTIGALTRFDLRLQGSYDCTNYFVISEEATAFSATGDAAAIIAYGYYPCVRIQILTLEGTGGAAVTVFYTGTVTPFQQNFAAINNTLGFKTVATLATNGASHTYSLNASGPLGGVVYFRFQAATCAGSTLAVTAGLPSVSANFTLLPDTALANSTATQTFFLPSFPGNLLTFTYTTGCVASGDRFDLLFGQSNVLQLIGTLNASGLPTAAGVGTSALQIQGTTAAGNNPVGNPVGVATYIDDAITGLFTATYSATVLLGRQVSAANAANVISTTLIPGRMLAIIGACSAGTSTLTTEVSADAVNWILIDTVAAAGSTVRNWTDGTVGGTVGVSAIAFAYVRITKGACGVGNTSTLTIGGK